MGFSINTTYSAFLIIPVIIIAAITVYILYYRKISHENISNFKKLLLLSTRFLVLIVLGFLLLKPIIKHNKTSLQNPTVLLAIDNSASMMLNNDSIYIRDSVLPLFNNLVNEKEGNINYKYICFGDSISYNSPGFNDNATNYEQLFNEFNSTFFNQNIGALVIVSDGIYNKGMHPKYAGRNASFPIYSVPVGDTIIKPDAFINRIEHNAVVYKGSQFPVEIGIQSNLMENKTVAIDIFRDNILVQSQKLNINSANFYKKVLFNLKADSSGVFKYDVRINSPINESNKLNNNKSFFVEIEDEKRKILIVQEGYHPDVSVLQTIIDKSPAFEAEMVNANELKSNIHEFDLVVLHQLPSNKNIIQNTVNQLIEKSTPVLFILGNQINIQALNNVLNYKIEHKKNLFDEVLPFYNNDFNLFNITISEQFFSELPPLSVPFGNYNAIPSSQVLFYQQVGSIESANPLWGFVNNGAQKIGFIMGEGIWKWRIQEYKKNNDHSITNELVMKTIQYLATKQKQETFMLDYVNIYNRNQTVNIMAKLFNASNELVKNADIRLNLIDEKGNTYPFVFKEFDTDYQANLGILNKGKYTFTAQTKYDGKEYLKNGTFIVNENQVEKSNLNADYNLMYQLAQQSGGKVINKQNINELINDLKNNPNIKSIKYMQKTIFDLINIKMLLAILILLLGVEWFLRKYWGLV